MYREAMEHLMKAPPTTSSTPPPAQPQKDGNLPPTAAETSCTATMDNKQPPPSCAAVVPGGGEACPEATVPPRVVIGNDIAEEAGIVSEEEGGADRYPDRNGKEGRPGHAAKVVELLSSDGGGGGSKERSGSASSVGKGGPDVSVAPQIHLGLAADSRHSSQREEYAGCGGCWCRAGSIEGSGVRELWTHGCVRPCLGNKRALCARGRLARYCE